MKKRNEQKLSAVQLYGFVAALIAFGVFILISSGMFDSPKVNAQQHTHTTNANPSVNLNTINRINELEETVKANPQNHETLLSLAHLLNDNGFYDRAISKYKTYLTTHPENADVIVDMGVCFFELKNYEESIKVIKSALKYNPKHQIAHFNLGIVNLANNNIEEAKSWWSKARDLDPNTNIGKKAEELIKSNN